MILVDTSVWVDHLRRSDKRLVTLLEQGLVCTHPMVIGELACGNLRNRHQLISLWRNLPTAVEASHDEAMMILETRQLTGCGIGYIDLHLLTATLLSAGTQLWTRDKRLSEIADDLGIGFPAN